MGPVKRLLVGCFPVCLGICSHGAGLARGYADTGL